MERGKEKERVSGYKRRRKKERREGKEREGERKVRYESEEA